MNKLATLILLSSLMSCASSTHQTESIESKIAGFEDRSDSEVNPIPSYKIRSFKKKSRGPASVGQELTKDISKLDNKKVYFLSLYEQYLTFSDLYPSFKKDVKTCAYFHQEFSSYNDKPKTWSYQLREDIDDNIENVVWHLPYDGERATKATLPLAMKEHMDRTYYEISKLCDNGFSDNYYVFENYISLAKSNKVYAGTSEGANSLVKTSLVFNKLLIDNLSTKKKVNIGRGLASKSEDIEYTEISFRRMQALWF
ncbi:hypothetical protein ABMA70_03810 [Halobacteriovorax sp. XZX-3]|uniref:hypothetical protein n=1 Tax=unclassified Halobacteriovorax TaxID=2639665 RepID=UPI000CD006D0|nr:hypothetical protein [Halobacteriovorax sp. DA5]POB15368.1 hypothetical protein C0Z22_02975 [Halobacteriovorax sp. DA5]